MRFHRLILKRGIEALSCTAHCIKSVMFTFIAAQHFTHYAEPFSQISTKTDLTM